MKTKLFAFIALMLLPLGMAAQSDPVKARLKAKYGFACRHGDGTSTDPFYYTVRRDGKEGACDANGREIIPPSRYDNVCLHGDGTNTDPFYYTVERDGKEGACDANGREIIPPSRYDNVCRHGDGTSTDPFHYSVERDGKEGACDANGREIIPPVYDDGVVYCNDVFQAKINGEWVSLGIGLTPDGTAKGTYTPATANTGNSSTSKLLYKGKYTLSGELYFVEEKKWVNDGPDETLDVEIYNDHINMLGYRFEFEHIDGEKNNVVYEYEDERYNDKFVIRRCLMNPSNHDLTYEVTVMGLDFTFTTIRAKMSKGVVKMPRHTK